MKKKVLVLYASYGSGHKSIANYIAQYIKKEDKNIEVATLDILTYSMKVVGSISQKVNSFFMLKTPVIHNFFYNLTSTKVGGDVVDSISIPMFLNKRMEKELARFNPDLVVATHFFGPSIAKYYNDKGVIKSEIVTVITDYDVIELWMKFHEDVKYFVVANKYMKKDLIKRGVSKNKIKEFGIPISPLVPTKFNRKEYLQKYNLSGKNKICIFFGGGGNGSSKTLPYIKKVAISNPKLDIIFVAGKNERSKEAVDNFVEINNLKNVRTIGFATNVPDLLELADFVISKPGGIQLTECLYFKKPVLMIRHSGGQEIANYKYFEKEGFGRFFKTRWGLNKHVKAILNNDKILKKYSNNMIKKSDNNDSIEKVYSLIKELLNNVK